MIYIYTVHSIPMMYLSFLSDKTIEKLNSRQRHYLEKNVSQKIKYNGTTIETSHLPKPSLTSILLVNFSPDLSLKRTLDLGVGLAAWLSIIMSSENIEAISEGNFSQDFEFSTSNDERLKSNIQARFSEWELRGWLQLG